MCALSSGPGAVATDQPDRVPVLVELFTSEGCSSCPPADALLERMLDAQPLAGVEIIGLGEHVDYWDHQGWRDRFSSTSFTERQQEYGSRFRTDSIYTPQMVVDGRSELVGSDGNAARRAIESAGTLPHGRISLAVANVADRADGPERTILPVSVMVSGLPAISRGDHADLFVAVTEDGLRSNVTRGENHGRTLTHAAVVRRLWLAGEPRVDDGGALAVPVRLDEAWRRDRLKIVAFVQERRSRAILASAVIPVPPR